MRQLFLAVCTAFALLAPSAFAHKDAHPGASPQAQAAKPKAVAAGTRDPRAYFTDTQLVNQDGRKVRFYTDMLKDRVVVVNVMYANCKEACPLITRQLTEVKDELGELFGKTVFFVSITSDPVRDTPPALKRFAQEQHADAAGWSFLTGSKENVDGILQRLGALSENVEEHATVLYILDVDNKRMRRMLPNLPPKAIAEAARIIATADKRVASAAAPVRD
ncbi:MAG: SCO family protein [Burkholderiales bacterium]|nr:SCO family protein [Burkholderiales bacterium]